MSWMEGFDAGEDGRTELPLAPDRPFEVTTPGQEGGRPVQLLSARDADDDGDEDDLDYFYDDDEDDDFDDDFDDDDLDDDFEEDEEVEDEDL